MSRGQMAAGVVAVAAFPVSLVSTAATAAGDGAVDSGGLDDLVRAQSHLALPTVATAESGSLDDLVRARHRDLALPTTHARDLRSALDSLLYTYTQKIFLLIVK